ncbi:hypothetical protein VA7868_02287 [Vibrio aerogenes CECT 7868]|uniref:Uncharacterized protein n=1 Tax=Vibrio aerogenes CECT 7868 TaxID=1216006 RepID=A0A1M5Z4Q7_9VIBR|nr:hypothetical protein VA7868_02287 [Vibrio aerogenes CECT 7868]
MSKQMVMAVIYDFIIHTLSPFLDNKNIQEQSPPTSPHPEQNSGRILKLSEQDMSTNPLK